MAGLVQQTAIDTAIRMASCIKTNQCVCAHGPPNGQWKCCRYALQLS